MSDARIMGSRGFLRGTLHLPGDKSISHRAAMLLAVSRGVAKISNYAGSEDCAATLACLERLGVSIEREGSTIIVEGVGLDGLKTPSEPLECGNSGTTMRLLSGLIAGADCDAVLTGDDSLRSRPMRRIVEPLTMMGAKIETSNGTAPIAITSSAGLKGIDYQLPVASAQVKSCVLFAGLNADGPVNVIGPPSRLKESVSRDHSERMLRYLGVSLGEDYLAADDLFKQVLTLAGKTGFKARNIVVPGDISTAAFFLVAAAGLKGSDVTVTDVGLNPSRTGVIDVMKECGIRISVDEVREACNEPRGNVCVSWDGECELTGEPFVISGAKTAGIIDEIPILAILGTLLPGGLEVRDASELRIKESDRIKAVVGNLKRMRADIVEFEDGFRVKKSHLEGAVVDSYGDHRIAMAFAVAGLFAEGETTITGAECVAVSFPGFFNVLERLSEEA